ncbi:uncharacterized protein [Arachis hypogaea]|uniref:uncharacterized protein n=1 Tax=Arachis hypogaea TaxID=3818 RepID=UPI003B20FAA0
MVIIARVGTRLVKQILVDTGSDSNIMFRNVLDALGIRDTDLKTHQHGVVGLGDNFIKPDGLISLPVSIRSGREKRSIMAEFVVLRDSTAYNIIIGRGTINELVVIIYKVLVMKFVSDNGTIGSIKGYLETAVACDNASLSLRKKTKEAAGVFLADLDARVDDKPMLEPEGDLEKVRVGDSEAKFTFVNKNLPHELKEPLVEIIRKNGDLFGWTPADTSGIDPKVMSHHLATAGLLEAGFIRELEYSPWLSNVVLVKKPSGKWRMCIDYSDLNKAFPNDSFPLLNIDALVDAASGYRCLSFMDAYSDYNKISMHQPDEEKMVFIMPGGTYCYKVMLFGLKNAGATYQRLMNKIFCDLIGKMVEVYVDDILIKTIKTDDLISNLESVFTALRRHGMRLNPLKCAFAMEAGKFLGFMITQKGVEANPEKCEAILRMASPRNLKDVQRLIVTDEGLATVLVREEGKVQQPVYSVSKVLQGVELRYSKLEKLAYVLLTSSRRLRHYFQGNQITIRTDQPIQQILQKLDLAGRMMTWEIELSQYDLQYEPRHAIKALVMANFLVKVTGDLPDSPNTQWKLPVDGASNQTFGGARIILEKYEALLGGLQLAREVGATRVEVCSDSQIVTSQVNGAYQAKDSLQKYLEQVKRLSKEFDEVAVQHVPREKNTWTGLLSKLASTKPGTGN